MIKGHHGGIWHGHKSGTAQLGDLIESAISTIGITPAAWIAWKQEHGLPPTCGCTARKEWLNRFGERFGKAAKAAASILYR